MKTGLVSVSFRGLSPEEIIDLAAGCGLAGIEWGGDVHVPPGELERARMIGDATRDRGLAVACYGSYCRLRDAEAHTMSQVVETAAALGAPLIRVWAGDIGSAQASREKRQEICRNAQRLTEMAAAQGIGVAFEWHGGTLTDTLDSALDLLANVKGASTLWQPPEAMDTDECVRQIRAAAARISNIHVFSWEGTKRLPLAQGAAKWRRCLQEVENLPGERWLLLEFVAGDDPQQLKQDACTLHRWLKGEWNE